MTLQVYIEPHAPPGPVVVNIQGTTTLTGATCSTTATVTVDRTYDTVILEYNTFIAAQALRVENAPPLIDPYHQGDNRWFRQHPTSRSHQTIGMSLQPSFTGYTLVGQFGTTRSYNDNPLGSDAFSCEFCPVDFADYEDWCLQPGATADCVATAVHGIGNNVLQTSYSRTSPTSALVHFQLVGKDPCIDESIVPAIDADLHVEFRQECDGSVLKPLEFRINGGQHDGFPWHELLFHVNMTFEGGTTTSIYQHDPCCTRETPTSLFGSGEWRYRPEDANDQCHNSLTGQPLQDWQTVPGLIP